MTALRQVNGLVMNGLFKETKLFLFIDFERWIQAFSAVVEQMSDYQRLRVSRITTPSKLCGGLKCLLIYPKKCPVVLGVNFNLNLTLLSNNDFCRVYYC